MDHYEFAGVDGSIHISYASRHLRVRATYREGALLQPEAIFCSNCRPPTSDLGFARLWADSVSRGIRWELQILGQELHVDAVKRT